MQHYALTLIHSSACIVLQGSIVTTVMSIAMFGHKCDIFCSVNQMHPNCHTNYTQTQFAFSGGATDEGLNCLRSSGLVNLLGTFLEQLQTEDNSKCREMQYEQAWRCTQWGKMPTVTR